jgi:serine protease Do
LALIVAGGITLAPRLIVPGPDHAAAAGAAAWSQHSGFADVVEMVRPAVFAVHARVPGSDLVAEGPGASPQSFREIDPQRRGRAALAVSQGAGFFVSSDGYAVTNRHVVEDNQTVNITTDDGKSYAARVVGRDARSDLALIKVDGRTDFAVARFSARTPRVGDWVLAMGNPFGLGGTVTAGIVSARERDIGTGADDDFIQIDAPVNKGNSGGPAFDIDGGVIGVNTAIYSPSGGSIGIAFAIPADTVKAVVAQLKRDGVVRRGFLGVQMQPVTADLADGLGLPRPEGALITDQQPNGPAALAGIAAGDVITSVDGAPIRDSRELARHIANLAPGAAARIGLIRGAEERTVTVTLGELPRPPEAVPGAAHAAPSKSGDGKPARLGLSLAPTDPAGTSAAGVIVTEVEPNGRGAERGLDVGDVILDVGGHAVRKPADVHGALADARKSGRRTVLMRVRNGDKTRFVALPPG